MALQKGNDKSLQIEYWNLFWQEKQVTGVKATLAAERTVATAMAL